MMHGHEKSDPAIVAVKPANKAEQLAANSTAAQPKAAESVEQRAGTKGNADQQSTCLTQSWTSVSQALERIRKVARERKKEKFTALFHHINTELLEEAFYELAQNAAPGVDRLTWKGYEADLERNIEDLHERVQRGAYRALPSRRVYIPKADGRQRPLAVAALEDKIVQRAVASLLNAIYESAATSSSSALSPVMPASPSAQTGLKPNCMALSTVSSPSPTASPIVTSLSADSLIAAPVQLLKKAAKSKKLAKPVTIVSYDEKPGIQAIATTAPDLPPVPRVHATFARDHEYKRHGTLSLLAGIDLLTGKVHALVRDRHRSREFIEFLKLLDAAYPAHTAIKLVLDNHSAHISRETKTWLATRPAGRFEFTFTPKHGSWLNLIEGFFSKFARSVLRHIRVASKQELKERVMAGIEDVNRYPVIHTWSYKLAEAA